VSGGSRPHSPVTPEPEPRALVRAPVQAACVSRGCPLVVLDLRAEAQICHERVASDVFTCQFLPSNQNQCLLYGSRDGYVRLADLRQRCGYTTKRPLGRGMAVTHIGVIRRGNGGGGHVVQNEGCCGERRCGLTALVPQVGRPRAPGLVPSGDAPERLGGPHPVPLGRVYHRCERHDGRPARRGLASGGCVGPESEGGRD
jgi:hypothetical protein